MKQDFAAKMQAQEALRFALDHDDGLRVEDYRQADVVLVGLSRSAKTLTSRYLATHHCLRVANYPIVLTDERPESVLRLLRAQRHRMFGMLARSMQRSAARGIASDWVEEQLRLVAALFDEAQVPYCDVSGVEVEHIANAVMLGVSTARAPWAPVCKPAVADVVAYG